MIIELQVIIQKIEELTEQEQLIIAKILDDELRWKTSLQNTEGRLSDLTKDVIIEYRCEKSTQEDW